MPQAESKLTEPRYRLMPRVGFLVNQSNLDAYKRARSEPWFHEALTYALARVCMSITKPEGREYLLAGASAFVDAFYNLDQPEAQASQRYSPLVREP